MELFMYRKYYMLRFENKYELPEVKSFLRLYGDVLESKFHDMSATDQKELRLPDIIEFLPLDDDENQYDDVVVKLENKIYISKRMIGELGFTYPELYAILAHELGHILYRTTPWGFDSEERADSFAAELGLGTQMISIIEKIIYSRRFGNMTSALVRRIQFLQLISDSFSDKEVRHRGRG